MLIDRYCRTNFSSYEDFKENFKINIPDNFNFGFDVVDELAKKDPDKRAIVWCDDNHREKTITFGELKSLSNRCVNMMRRLNVAKGDFVMTTLRSRYEYWIVAVAAHKLGAVLVPATHQLTEKDLKYRVAAAGIKVIFTVNDSRLIACINAAQAETGGTLKHKLVVDGNADGFLNFDDEMSGESCTFDRPTGTSATQNSDPFLVYFTSGTAGLPKMVMHNYTYPLGHILTAKFWQTLNENDLHFTSADTGWAKTSWGKIYGQWICESAVFVYDYGTKFKPTDLLDVVAKHRVTVFCAPPVIFRFLIKEDLSKYDLSSLRYCTIAGEALNAEVYNKWLQLTGLRLIEGFGQTESAVLIATYPWLEPKPGSTGKPSPHFNTTLINSDGMECEVGEEGELCVNVSNGIPAGLCQCYYKDAEKTAAAMKNGWYHTGDMAWKDEDGYIWFVGRADDVIKSSGYRIGPYEVESALMEHPAVLETAITAVPDPQRGQIVKATVVLAKGFRPEDRQLSTENDRLEYLNRLKKELQDHVKRTTAPYKYPRVVDFVSELPKTISGKIRRVEIRRNDEK